MSANGPESAPAAGDSNVTTYTWDNHNRLTSVTFQQTEGTNTYQMQYGYDTFDRLVTADQTVGGGDTPLQERYYYNGDDLVLVLDGNGNVTERELYGPAVDQVLASENATTGASPGSWPTTKGRSATWPRTTPAPAQRLSPTTWCTMPSATSLGKPQILASRGSPTRASNSTPRPSCIITVPGGMMLGRAGL